MHRYYRIIFTVVSIFSAIVAKAEPNLEAALTTRYGNVAKMTADLTQRKSSPYLFKPLMSHVKLVYTPTEIVWQVIDPVQSTATLSANGLKISQDGKEQTMRAQDDAKLGSLIGLLSAILRLDFATIRIQCDLKFAANSILATVKKNIKNAPPIDYLQIDFSPTLEPRSMAIKGGEEVTNLEFRNVVIVQSTTAPEKAEDRGASKP